MSSANALPVRKGVQPGIPNPTRPSATATSTLANVTFIFEVTELRPNYENQPNRATEHPQGFFLPPDRINAFHKGAATRFLWRGGNVAPWSVPTQLTRYRVATVFSQRPSTDHLLVVDVNALLTDVATSVGWRNLSFEHIPVPNSNSTYASVTSLGGQQHLAAHGPARWMPQLVPFDYDYQALLNDYPTQPATASAGLIGNLPLLVALAAFSAPSNRLNAVMTGAMAPRSWRPHQNPTGRIPERGMVVTIYYDPANPTHSTRNNLERLQNGGFGPFYA